jgi:hypothetical protein
MSEFKWHLMADEQPTDEDATYLVMGKRGAMYLASGFHVWWHDGRRSFYIPNNRHGYMDFDKVRAWAVIPEFKEGK